MCSIFFERPVTDPTALPIEKLFPLCDARYRSTGDPWYQLAALIVYHQRVSTTNWHVTAAADVRQKMRCLRCALHTAPYDDDECKYRRAVVAAQMLRFIVEGESPPMFTTT